MVLDGIHRKRLRARLIERDAVSAASAVRDAYCLTPTSSIENCYVAEGWRVRVRPVSRPSSGLRAILVPLVIGGFSVVVNAQHDPTAERVEWLLAHEFAHTLFFVEGAPPRRCVPYTRDEEWMCDAFADAFARSRGDERVA